MEIKNILIKDDKGILGTDAFKYDPSTEALGVIFDPAQPNTRVLAFSPNNVNFGAVPNMVPSSYQVFVTYNGTLGYSNRMFSTVVAEEHGVFDLTNIPTTVYDPNGVNAVTNAEELQDVVIEISMFNGVVDVLNYSEGYLNVGNKDYVVQSRRAFPTVITSMPHIDYKKVQLDGWYSYTFIAFRDISVGATIIKGIIYGIDGFIFKAPYDGVLYEDAEGYYSYSVSTPPIKGYLEENHNYEDHMFNLNQSSGISGNADTVYLHTQVLITDTIRDAIVAEVIEISCQNNTGCDFMDWQKLSMKRMAAYVMFENGLYEKAQVIMESARTMCLNKKIDLTC